MSQERQGINLALLIATDLARKPLRVLLYLLVLFSAASVILSAHHNRELSIVHEQLMQEQDKLDVEWRNLVLEQSALTEHNRIEALVKKKLNMYRPSPEDEVVVRVK